MKNSADTIIQPVQKIADAAIAGLLREARQSVGFTLRELAKRTGASHSMISAYEHGRKSPSLPLLKTLLAECGVDMELRLTRRIRHRDGLERGEELEQVLALAEKFPAKHERKLMFPPFGKRPCASS